MKAGEADRQSLDRVIAVGTSGAQSFAAALTFYGILLARKRIAPLSCGCSRHVTVSAGRCPMLPRQPKIDHQKCSCSESNDHDEFFHHLSIRVLNSAELMRLYISGSGICNGCDRSALRSSSSAWCQNSFSRPVGFPLRSQISKARSAISCSLGSGMRQSPGGARPYGRIRRRNKVSAPRSFQNRSESTSSELLGSSGRHESFRIARRSPRLLIDAGASGFEHGQVHQLVAETCHTIAARAFGYQCV
jgi:hypothetical protein